MKRHNFKMAEYRIHGKLENTSTAVEDSTARRQIINYANQVIDNSGGQTLRRALHENGVISDPDAEAAHPQLPTNPDDTPLVPTAAGMYKDKLRREHRRIRHCIQSTSSRHPRITTPSLAPNQSKRPNSTTFQENVFF